MSQSMKFESVIFHHAEESKAIEALRRAATVNPVGFWALNQKARTFGRIERAENDELVFAYARPSSGELVRAPLVNVRVTGRFFRFDPVFGDRFVAAHLVFDEDGELVPVEAWIC
jgi:hypothetical protein